MHITSNNRIRPAAWLVCAASVSAISFWFPLVVNYYHDNEYISRAVTGAMLVFIPIGCVASVVGLCCYVALCRRSTRSTGTRSPWVWFIGGGLATLIAIAPAMLILFCLVAALILR